MLDSLNEEKKNLAWIKKYFIPFYNSKSDDEIKKTFTAAYVGSLWQDCESQEGEGYFSNLIRERFNKPLFLKEVKEAKAFLEDVVKIAFLGERDEELPPELKKKTPEIEKRIRHYFLEQQELEIKWRGKNENYVVTSYSLAGQGDDRVGAVTRHAVLAITTCFCSSAADFNFEKGIGFEKVGMCPNCEIFFEKKRKDQEYCSAKCQKAAGMRRIREEKKTEEK